MKIIDHRPGLVPVRKFKASAACTRRIIAAFEARGSTFHSSLAITLPVVIEYCEEKRIPYTLRAAPGSGYMISKVPEIGNDETKPNNSFE